MTLSRALGAFIVPFLLVQGVFSISHSPVLACVQLLCAGILAGFHLALIMIDAGWLADRGYNAPATASEVQIP